MNASSGIVRRTYSLLVSVGTLCQSPLLLIIRLYFFWQLFNIGLGKLENIAKVTDYFSSLGVPLPALNVYVVGCTECIGGMLILLGLVARLASIPVTVAMVVAYLVGDHEAVASIFNDSDKFIKADPFPYLLSALIILCFGPGWFSLDAIVGRLFRRKREE